MGRELSSVLLSVQHCNCKVNENFSKGKKMGSRCYITVPRYKYSRMFFPFLSSYFPEKALTLQFLPFQYSYSQTQFQRISLNLYLTDLYPLHYFVSYYRWYRSCSSQGRSLRRERKFDCGSRLILQSVLNLKISSQRSIHSILKYVEKTWLYHVIWIPSFFQKEVS